MRYAYVSYEQALAKYRPKPVVSMMDEYSAAVLATIAGLIGGATLDLLLMLYGS